ncbi:hypothetical protein [Rhizobacter sp. P5_C2]
MSIHQLRPPGTDSGTPSSFDAGGGSGDDGEMEARVAKLEAIAEKTGEKLTAIDLRLTKLETRSESFATKADVSDAKYQIVVWVVATFILSQVLPIVLKKFGL